MKKYLFFYLIAIVMMANDALFNWIGSMIGVPFWRQLIWVTGLYILFKIVRKRMFPIPYVRRTYNKYISLAAIVALLAIFTILIEGFNTVRIIMSFFEYFFGIIFIVFPFVCAQSGWKKKYIYRFFIGLGFYISTGLLIDFSIGGAITSFFQLVNAQSVDEYQFEYYGRFSFLSTTDSIFTLILSLSIFCCFREYTETKHSLKRVLLVALSGYIIFGSIFTGARQTLAGLLIVETFGFLYILWGNKRGVAIFTVSFFLLLIALPFAQNILSTNVGFEKRFNKEALQEDERSKIWREGFQYCFVNTNPRRILIGDGVGYTLGSYAAPNETKSRHYENTFLARTIDVGVPMAIALLLTPVFYIIKWHKKRKVNLLYYGFIMSYVFIGLISPNAASNQSQMSLFILLALFYIDNDRETYLVR